MFLGKSFSCRREKFRVDIEDIGEFVVYGGVVIRGYSEGFW